MKIVTASIVTYRNDEAKLQIAIDSLLSSDIDVKLYIINNAPEQKLDKLFNNSNIEYIETDKNLGFGKAHNIAIKKAFTESDYHVVINPDVYFDTNTIRELKKFMDADQQVGLVMPKILYPDGKLQYNCKLLPTPQNLIIRRFLQFSNKLLALSNYNYEMQFSDYNQIMEVPVLSGCFMFLRNRALQDVGLFDERFFLYAEDVDLTRRIHMKYKTMYFPEVTVFHHHEKGSYKSFRLMLQNSKSVIAYFNKWGWWNDNTRNEINNKILDQYDLEPSYTIE